MTFNIRIFLKQIIIVFYLALSCSTTSKIVVIISSSPAFKATDILNGFQLEQLYKKTEKFCM